MSHYASNISYCLNLILRNPQCWIAYQNKFTYRKCGGIKGMQKTLLFVAAAITGPLLVSAISSAITGSEHSECCQYTAARSKVNRSVT